MKKFGAWYLLVSQIIFSLLIPTAVGALIAKKSGYSSVGIGVAALIGFGIGFVSSISFALNIYRKLIKTEKKETKPQDTPKIGDENQND